MVAFWDLSTERKYELGPIPWSAVREYAAHWEFDGEATELLICAIQSMDRGYRSWKIEEVERSRKAK